MGLFKFTVSVEAPSFEEEDIVTGITLTANHILVIVDASSAVKITLPASTSGTGKIDGEQTVVLNLQYQYVTIANDSGTVYIFKKIDSSGNSVTIDASGSDEWHIIGGQDVKMEEILKAQETLLETLRRQLDGIWKCLSSMSSLNNYKEEK